MLKFDHDELRGEGYIALYRSMEKERNKKERHLLLCYVTTSGQIVLRSKQEISSIVRMCMCLSSLQKKIKGF
jgi:hypothetical protein